MSNPFAIELRPHWLNGQAIYTVVVIDENGAMKYRDQLDLGNAVFRARCIDRLKTITGKPIDQLDAEILLKIQEDESAAASSAQSATEFDLGLISSEQFSGTEYKLTWLVKHLLVKGQPCIVGGPRKALKTSILIDLALSLGHGRQFLNKFYVPEAVNVAMLSGESGAATIQETARRIAISKGVTLSGSAGVWGFTLPLLSRLDHFDTLTEAINRHKLTVLILDPAYLCLLNGNTEAQASNLFDMGAVLGNVARIGQQTGCTIVLAHHFTKLTSYEPPELDQLAFSGFQEFARQWVLIGRRERYESGSGQHKLWLNVGGSAGFGGLHAVDIDEGVIDENFQGRQWGVSVVSATQARSESEEQAAEKREQAKETKRQAIIQIDRERALKAFRLFPEGETKSALRDASGLESGRFNPILAILLGDKTAERCRVTKGNKQSYDGYRLSRIHSDTPGYPTASDSQHTQWESPPLIEGDSH